MKQQSYKFLKFFNKHEKKFLLFLSSFILIPATVLIISILNLEIIGSSEDFINQEGYCNMYLSSEVLDQFNNKEAIVKKEKRDVYIFPELSNLKCLGFVTEINSNDMTNDVITLYYGSNSKVFNYLDTFFNLTLICSLIFLRKKNLSIVLIIYLIFNILNFKVFNPLDLSYKIFLPIIGPESIDSTTFLKNLFMIFFFIKINNNKGYLILLTYILFFSVDYFGIFVVLIYLKNRFGFSFSKSEQKYFILLPLFFYILRIFSTFTEQLNYFWITLGQRVYRGFTVFPDLQWTLFGLRCNGDPNSSLYFGNVKENKIVCYDLRGGPLDSYLSINGDVQILSLVIGNLSIVLLLICFYYLLSKYQQHYVLLVFLILSPPMNHLTFYGNDDLIILLISLYCLINFKKNSLFKVLLILIISLFNLHPAPLLGGIFLVALKEKNKKIILYSSIAISIFSALFFVDLIYNSKNINNAWLAPGYGFGIYLDILLLDKYFDFSLLISTSLILIFIIFLYRFLKVKENKILISQNISDVYLVIPSICWFLVTFLYTNNTYRIPLFYCVFFLFFINANDTLRKIILFFIFLEPIVLQSYLSSKLFIMAISDLSSYILFVLFMIYLFDFLKDFLNPLREKIKLGN